MTTVLKRIQTTTRPLHLKILAFFGNFHLKLHIQIPRPIFQPYIGCWQIAEVMLYKELHTLHAI